MSVHKIITDWSRGFWNRYVVQQKLVVVIRWFDKRVKEQEPNRKLLIPGAMLEKKLPKHHSEADGGREI